VTSPQKFDDDHVRLLILTVTEKIDVTRNLEETATTFLISLDADRDLRYLKHPLITNGRLPNWKQVATEPFSILHAYILPSPPRVAVNVPRRT
jgi:hypothetical protein